MGDTGVGKEVLAKHLHRASERSAGPFVRLSCGALPAALLERELFGCAEGAGEAGLGKPGLLEAASGGTLFLDDLGEVPRDLQLRLLRVLQESRVLRLGEQGPREVDVRVVAATHLDLQRESAEGRFRQDLYDWIAGVTLPIPPLRDRPAEILPMAMSILRAAARRMEQPVPRLTHEAQVLLLGYSWPGNLRELRTMLERAVLLQTSDAIGPDELPSQRMKATFALIPKSVPRARRSANDEDVPPEHRKF